VQLAGFVEVIGGKRYVRFVIAQVVAAFVTAEECQFQLKIRSAVAHEHNNEVIRLPAANFLHAERFPVKLHASADISDIYVAMRYFSLH
jgi:hypothetical protein